MAAARVALIFCAGAGKRNMEVARHAGWLSGARSDETISDIHRPLHLLDVHWTRYDWPTYVAVAARERPALAVVPDTGHLSQMARTVAQAEELAAYVTEAVLIVPKAAGLTERLPRCVGGRQVRLAYSVPTKYGGIPDVPAWEFAGWPVHLLGGSPYDQLRHAHYLSVVSADGNASGKVSRWGIVYCLDGKRRTLKQIDGQRWPADAGLPYEALRRSLTTIPLLWQRAGFQTTVDV
jgi:hypothetical protein